MRFLKTTAIGGLVFLVPFVIVAVILGKAFRVMRGIVDAIQEHVPSFSAFDFLVLDAIAILVLFLLCFLAGLVARSAPAKRLGQKLEEGLQANLPGYSIIKGVTDNLRTSEEQSKDFLPVMARFDDNAQVAFEVERLPTGEVVVYLPGCPDPWSGSVVTMAADRVESIAMSVAEALRNIRTMGRGSTEMLERVGKVPGAEPGDAAS